MSEVRYASFNPEAFVQGGTLLDDADVIVRNPRITHFTYPGGKSTTTALVLEFEDAESKKHEQPYSIGQPEKFAPSDDGSKVLLTGTATAINKSSNFAQFIASLINSGVPVSLFQTDDIKAIDGLRIHVNAVAQKDKSGNVVKNDKGYDRTVLLATKLIALPGEKPKSGGAKATAGSKPAAAPAQAAAEVSDELADKAVRYLSTIAGEQGGSVPRAKVSTLVFQAAMKAKDDAKQQLMKVVFDEGFLKANSGRPVVDGDTAYAFEYDEASKVISKAA
jgi:hypothetical protein